MNVVTNFYVLILTHNVVINITLFVVVDITGDQSLINLNNTIWVRYHMIFP